jgi:hypothetical protein
MKERRIRIEDLLGRVVRDGNNGRLGRIEEIEVSNSPSGCFVSGFLLGPTGLLKRLSFTGIRPLFFRPLLRPDPPIRLRWDEVDLSKPSHPRLIRSEREKR